MDITGDTIGPLKGVRKTMARRFACIPNPPSSALSSKVHNLVKFRPMLTKSERVSPSHHQKIVRNGLNIYDLPLCHHWVRLSSLNNVTHNREGLQQTALDRA